MLHLITTGFILHLSFPLHLMIAYLLSPIAPTLIFCSAPYLHFPLHSLPPHDFNIHRVVLLTQERAVTFAFHLSLSA